MAVEVVQFLVRKFVDRLTEEEAAAGLPFSAQFHDMRAELEKAAVSPTNADELRECLYELNDLLAACRELANRPSPRRWLAPPGASAWRLRKTQKRVAAARRRVLQCVGNDPAGAPPAAAAAREDGAAAGLDRWTTSWVEPGRVHGLDRQLAELEAVAFADCAAGRLTGVGVVGMGGVGKTALAQLLFGSPRARARFRPRIWMCMSRTARAGADVRREVLQGMLMALGHEEDAVLSVGGTGGDGLAELVFAVHEQLRGKRYLIVFDDVWHVDGWYADVVGRRHGASRRPDDRSERLAFGLPKERGGLVVVTNRLEQAAEVMVGKGCLHRVQPLADGESCWAIFMDALAPSKEKMPGDLSIVNSMKEEIIETCGGLPSAAKTMGDIFARSLSSPPSTSSSQELTKNGRIINNNSGSLK